MGTGVEDAGVGGGGSAGPGFAVEEGEEVKGAEYHFEEGREEWVMGLRGRWSVIEGLCFPPPGDDIEGERLEQS